MRPLVVLSLATILSAETGLRPRADATEYDAHAAGAGATIAAAVLTPAQAKKLFAVDLHKLGYTVIEIAVFPKHDVEVTARDFLLRVTGDSSTIRAAAPSTIAGRLRRKDEPPKVPKLPEGVQVGGSQTIGVASGPYGQRGVYTGTTVGVGIGGPGPAPSPQPRRSGKDNDSVSVQVDLENQSLPEGRVTKAVAGYLYFPVIPKKKETLEITWYGADGQVRLPLPAAK